MKANTRHLTIALAGVFQSLRLVQLTASNQYCDDKAFDACVNGIFSTDPDSVETVFGDLSCLTIGLDEVAKQLGTEKRERDMELTRYAVTVLYLERKLSKNRAMLDLIRSGIDKAREQAGFLGLTHASVIASLAESYKQTISTLRPRIIVSGDQVILGNPDMQNQIRTLLLAAIRSAVLWRQCGGGRLTLLLQRKRLLEAVHTLQDEARRSG
ncbi:MAG: high frequency lysogenization protein HflD [Gammaproteobacteria bacterium]|nr:MAG: high frequency lysogenization protein HflD [Gammaproteobacteria bacterium]